MTLLTKADFVSWPSGEVVHLCEYPKKRSDCHCAKWRVYLPPGDARAS